MGMFSIFKSRLFSLLPVLLLGVFIGEYANASIVIDGTRVIYPEEKSEVSVRMTNEGEEPKLVQVWIDDGDKQASPEKIKVPFAVLNPIFRMDPKKGQVTRIQYLHDMPLPEDRESVFWLNVLEIPAKPKVNGQDDNYLQFRYRTRIKLFLRPKGLASTAAEALDSLIVKYKPGYVQLENPTSYYLSITELQVGENSVGGKVVSQMIEPFSKKMIELKGAVKDLTAPMVKYKAINDYGGATEKEKSTIAF